MRSKFKRSDIRNFLYESLNMQPLREEVTIMGNQLDVVDGKIIFNDKIFELTSGVFNIPVLKLTDTNGPLEVTVKPPFVPLVSSGKPITSTIEDPVKIKSMIDGFKSGKTFVIEVLDEEGEPQELTFANVG